jgi:hypothetical protein
VEYGLDRRSVCTHDIHYIVREPDRRPLIGLDGAVQRPRHRESTQAVPLHASLALPLQQSADPSLGFICLTHYARPVGIARCNMSMEDLLFLSCSDAQSTTDQAFLKRFSSHPLHSEARRCRIVMTCILRFSCSEGHHLRRGQGHKNKSGCTADCLSQLDAVLPQSGRHEKRRRICAPAAAATDP